MKRIRIRPRPGEPLCSDEEKAQIVAEIRRRHEREGISVQGLAEEFGISATSYSNWSKQFPPAPMMRPVEILPVLPPACPVSRVLISPQGYRVEGLAVAEIAQLLRLLA